MIENKSHSALDVVNLSASYGSKQVLKDVSFSVGKGQTYGLIGLNGVGKTTLIKIALGLKSPQSGCVTVFGRQSSDSAVRYDISYLPERFDPPWFLKGGEFVEFAASLYGRKVLLSNIESACEKLALDPKVLENKVQTYSKGMRQKLGLVATVLTGSQILILDEPMSGLDPLARSLVKNLLRSVKEEGRTVILSSHILADMDEICDIVTVIDSCHVQFSGTPSEMKVQTQEQYLEKSFLKIIGKAA
ncbi:MAG: ABC transporter ATP-binding protein [Alphaproteobacteria bacterium]|nr:ABC transporter ATP-binding protein [Alphaproteobacteria bacterium]